MEDPNELDAAPVIEKVSPHGASSHTRITYVGQVRRHLKDDEWGGWQVATLEGPTESVVRESLVTEGLAKWVGRKKNSKLVSEDGYRTRVVKVNRTLSVKVLEDHE